MEIVKKSQNKGGMSKATNFKPGIYQHFKGNKYLAIGVAKHSETLEEFVFYIPLYDNIDSKIWIRTLSMFMEEVDVNGTKNQRFNFLNSC